MIKVDRLNVKMEGNAAGIAKELCYGLVQLRFKLMDEAEQQGVSVKRVDSAFKMMILGGIANSLSDEEDGFISEEMVAQKLHEIAERAFEADKDGINWKEELN